MTPEWIQEDNMDATDREGMYFLVDKDDPGHDTKYGGFYMGWLQDLSFDKDKYLINMSTGNNYDAGTYAELPNNLILDDALAVAKIMITTNWSKR